MTIETVCPRCHAHLEVRETGESDVFYPPGGVKA